VNNTTSERAPRLDYKIESHITKQNHGSQNRITSLLLQEYAVLTPLTGVCSHSSYRSMFLLLLQEYVLTPRHPFIFTSVGCLDHRSGHRALLGISHFVVHPQIPPWERRKKTLQENFSRMEERILGWPLQKLYLCLPRGGKRKVSRLKGALSAATSVQFRRLFSHDSIV
jgi:hypothetical protein